MYNLHLFLMGGQTPMSPQMVGMVESCAIKALILKKKLKYLLCIEHLHSVVKRYIVTLPYQATMF